MQTEILARFGHHPDPAIDFCCEVEALETAAEDHRLGLVPITDWPAFDARIDNALRFRVGAVEDAKIAKDGLRKLAEVRGFVMHGSIGYEGQPWPRDTAREQFEPLRYEVTLMHPNGSETDARG